ncbi:hypothetical protein BU15DRAFT_65944 [Melanogaster broomeanus]|nr:hypothetical protein BU15DRAFT_65944 [Melanogaster broomeanus]
MQSTTQRSPQAVIDHETEVIKTALTKLSGMARVYPGVSVVIPAPVPVTGRYPFARVRVLVRVRRRDRAITEVVGSMRRRNGLRGHGQSSRVSMPRVAEVLGWPDSLRGGGGYEVDLQRYHKVADRLEDLGPKEWTSRE